MTSLVEKKIVFLSPSKDDYNHKSFVLNKKWLNQNLLKHNIQSFFWSIPDIDFSADSLREFVEVNEIDSQTLFCVVRNPGKVNKSFIEWVVESEQTPGHTFYFDEIDSTDRKKIPIRRPIFSPIRFRYQDYLGSLVLLKPEGILDFLSSDNELFSQWLTNSAEVDEDKIFHVPIFGFDMKSKIFAVNQLKKINYNPKIFPKVSILIPTQGIKVQNEKSLVETAIRSILEKSTYPNFEILVIADSGHDPDLLDDLQKIPTKNLLFLEWKNHFNYSQKMNFAAVNSTGDYLLMLNDDVTVITPDWIEQMIALASMPQVGMVGAHLFFPDDTIQHYGQCFYRGGPSHIGMGKSRDFVGPDNVFLSPREVTGVTAACSLISREKFFKAGGFTTFLPSNFNDVDLCLKLRSIGFDNVVTPFAELYHHESKTRNAHVHFFELDFLESRWGHQILSDEYWPSHPFLPEKMSNLDLFFGRGIYNERSPF